MEHYYLNFHHSNLPVPGMQSFCKQSEHKRPAAISGSDNSFSSAYDPSRPLKRFKMDELQSRLENLHTQPNDDASGSGGVGVKQQNEYSKNASKRKGAEFTATAPVFKPSAHSASVNNASRRQSARPVSKAATQQSSAAPPQPPTARPGSQKPSSPPHWTLGALPTPATSRPDLILPVPKPTRQYLMNASNQPQSLPYTQPILIVIDLNGTLVHRNRHNQTIFPRPFVPAFLEYLLTNFHVMVWSSARAENVQKMCTKLFTPQQRKQVIAEWGRDRLGLTPAQYNNKVQVYKRLTTVWNDKKVSQTHPAFAQGARWNQSNTVLLDDSVLKASSEPFNLIEIPEFKNTPEQIREDYLGKVAAYLEELKWQADVSAFIHKDPFKPDGWVWAWSEHYVKQEVERLKKLNGGRGGVRLG